MNLNPVHTFMYHNPRTMLDNNKIKLIDELRLLYQQYSNLKSIEQENNNQKFLSLCDELNKLYKIEQDKIENQFIKPFLDKYTFLQKHSSLYVLGKSYHENSHSLFLKYIWDSNPHILKNFLKNVIGENHSFIDSISENSYDIECEKSVKDGRIDLHIVDNNKKWVVIIENKINSKIHNGGKTNRSQLAIYKRATEREYKQYSDKVYILLSFTTNQKYVDDWYYSDYYKVFWSMLPHYSKNEIIRDYLKSLFYILHNNEELFTCNSLTKKQLLYNRVISKIK